MQAQPVERVGARAVLLITRYRILFGGKVRTYLVRSTSLQFQLKKRVFSVFLKNFVVRHRLNFVFLGLTAPRRVRNIRMVHRVFCERKVYHALVG